MCQMLSQMDQKVIDSKISGVAAMDEIRKDARRLTTTTFTCLDSWSCPTVDGCDTTEGTGCTQCDTGYHLHEISYAFRDTGLVNMCKACSESIKNC